MPLLADRVHASLQRARMEHARRDEGRQKMDNRAPAPIVSSSAASGSSAVIWLRQDKPLRSACMMMHCASSPRAACSGRSLRRLPTQLRVE